MPLSFTLPSPTLCLPLPFSLTAHPPPLSPLPLSLLPSPTHHLSLSPPFSHTLLCLTTLFPSLLNGEQVSGTDYDKCLRELVNICVLCNDSELAYNEVGKNSTISPDVCLSFMYLDSMQVYFPLKLGQAMD